MADWGQLLNFEPATPEECKAARLKEAENKYKAGNTCNPTNTCNANAPPGNFEPVVDASKQIIDLLGETVQGKDGDVRVDTFAKPNSVVGLFFSGHWCPPSRQFTPTLIAFYKRFKATYKESKALEIVFISSDRSTSEFEDYWGDMPWPTFPFGKRDQKQVISKKFGVTGIPTLVLLDGGTGEVITKNGRDIPGDDPEGLQYPWKPRPFNQIIREGKLVDNKGVHYEVDFAVKGKIVGVFFSGHWCPPSQAFTPKLVEAYNHYQKSGKQFEIIFCSWDRSESEFEDYFAEMPWMAVPHGDKRATELKKLYGVTGIPSLTILDENGKLITNNGRSRVDEDPEGKEFPWHSRPLTRLGSGTADVVNTHPTLILIAEKESDIPDIENVLLDLAKEHHDKGEKQEIFFMYITKERSDRVMDAVLKLCSLELTGAFPVIILLDLPNRKFYLSDLQSPTAAQARQFVESYSQGRLVGTELK